MALDLTLESPCMAIGMHDQTANKPQIFGKKMIRKIKLDFAALNLYIQRPERNGFHIQFIYIQCSFTAHYIISSCKQRTRRVKGEDINQKALSYICT